MKESCTEQCADQVKADADPSPITDTQPNGGFVSQFSVPKMDCPSEERMIRMALDDLGQESPLNLIHPIENSRSFMIIIWKPYSHVSNHLAWGLCLNTLKIFTAVNYLRLWPQRMPSIKKRPGYSSGC